LEQTVVKALSVLEALVEAERPQRLTELANALSMTKPNVYRLLGTLSHLGYVQQDAETSLYRPTLKVWEMGATLVGRVDLVSAAAPCIRRLSEAARESTQLAVFDQGYAVYVDKVDSPQPLKAITSIGSRVPASCVSTGKAMLAWLPDESVRAAMKLIRKFTPNTKDKRRDVDKDLEDARRLGYAVNRGEWRVGVCGIAAPVRDRLGGVVAAVGVWGAELNILGARREELAELAMNAAAEVSRQLGYIRHQPKVPALPPAAERMVQRSERRAAKR
jgi:IclR family transcriptional regulator, KDG regulon repressor